MKIWVLCLAFLMGAISVQAQNLHSGMELIEKIKQSLAKQPGEYAFAFVNLQTGEELGFQEEQIFHAASTMKTPIMVEIFRQAALGKFSLEDSLVIKNQFKSIVDNSPYQLSEADDSEFDLYKMIGSKMTIKDLMVKMIILSSNLATNMMIELVGANQVTQSLQKMGISDMQVLRGVEDAKAYQLGKNNVTTAKDLKKLFALLAEGKLANERDTQKMIAILLDQQFNDLIPALLPKEVRVAHKTGTITGLHHDSGIVYLPDGRKYVVVFLSRKLADEKAATELMASCSKMLYDYVMAQTNSKK